MPRQLAFHLPARPALGRGDFFVSPANEAALAQVSDDAAWPNGKLALVGPEGSGKTHLVHVWAKERGAVICAAGDLTEAAIPELVKGGRVAVEDVDAARGRPGVEDALFHLHNLVLAEGGRLLVTGRTPPARWAIGLPDLKSRVAGMAVATLGAPDDPLLAALLVKLLADRQIDAQPNLVDYLMARIPRSFAAAQSTIETLDATALALGRPLTRALAGEILDNGRGEGP